MQKIWANSKCLSLRYIFFFIYYCFLIIKVALLGYYYKIYQLIIAVKLFLIYDDHESVRFYYILLKMLIYIIVNLHLYLTVLVVLVTWERFLQS